MWEFWRGKLVKGRTSPRSTTTAGSPRNPDRRTPAVVNFKDLNLSVDDELSEDPHTDSSYHEDEDPTNKASIIRTKNIRSGAQKNKLIIIMVGLPGRGKTFLCNKLKCYLNWLGHTTAHFNVGNYRRLQKEANEVQDASFFDSHNQYGIEARTKALQAALSDVMRFLTETGGQVAIFDATNTTKERRQQLINTFHGRCQYIFIESVCNDTQVLENNYRYKMKYSPDYQGIDTEAALADFKERIYKYNEVYEPIDDRRLHYIKLIDMVTGRGYMDVNRISGYIPGKIVFFLMQVCKAGMTAGQSRKIWLTRHGESQFNMAGRIGGDSGLTARGEEYARLLPDVLESRLPATFNESGVPVSVWTSTLRRTIATANYLPYPKLRWKALDEIHAGVCDGMTYSEIAQRFPEDYEARKRDKLRYRYPSGESYLDVVQRLEPVIIEMEREREYVMVVGHQAVLRAIFGYFMAIPLEKIPRLDIPLHTLIELQPRPDGTMEVAFLPVPVSTSSAAHPSVRPPLHTGFNPNPPVQLPLGFSPSPTNSPPGLLATFNSLPAGYFYGHSSRERLSAGGAPGSPGLATTGGSGSWQGIVAAAAGHRRTSSASAMTFPKNSGQGMHPSASFATISSMGTITNSSSQSSLAGTPVPESVGSRVGSAAALATSSRDANADTCDIDVSRLQQQGLGEQYRAILQAGSASNSKLSNTPAYAAAAAQEDDTAPRSGGGAEPLLSDSGASSSANSSRHISGGRSSMNSSSGTAVAAAPGCPFQDLTLSESVAAELELQGLALDESVVLTSGASSGVLATTAAAIAIASTSNGSITQRQGLGIPGLAQQHSGGSSTGSSSGHSPVIAPILGSMNSVD